MSMTEHTCVRCGKELKVPDRYRGQELKCPGCGRSFRLAAAGAPAAPAAPSGPTGGERSAPPATAKAPPARAEAPAGPSGLGGWLALIIGWLLLVSLTTLYQYLRVREMLDDTTVVRNLERLQSGQILQYARTVEWLNALMVFAVVIALLSIFSYRKWARAVVVTVLLLAMGLGAWDYFWVTRVFDESTRELLQIRPGAVDLWLAGRVVGCGLALAYFLGSTRVKNTFVK